MKDPQLTQRLQILKSEFEAGQKRMAELEAQKAHLRDTLLRISGAIQVLEELLSDPPEIEKNGSQEPEAVKAEGIA